MAWLNGWSYRKTVTITGETGAGANYQVNFSIGDAAGGDFNLESHCTSFPNDIQVTDNDQTTPLDYWVEDLTVDPISMWVEVADDLGSNVDICVYYGKTGESSASDGTNTFEFFDDFEGTSIDTDIWDEDVAGGGSISVSGSIAHFSVTDADDSYAGIFGLTSFGSPVIHEFCAKFPIGGDQKYAKSGLFKTKFQLDTSADDDRLMFFIFDGTSPTFRDWFESRDGANEDHYDYGTYDSANYHTYGIKYKSTAGGDAEFFVDYSSVWIPPNYSPNEPLYIEHGVGRTGSSNACDLYVDWTLIRKYASPEPAFLSVGSEETPPVAGIGRLVYGGLVNDGLTHGRLVA